MYLIAPTIAMVFGALLHRMLPVTLQLGHASYKHLGSTRRAPQLESTHARPPALKYIPKTMKGGDGQEVPRCQRSGGLHAQQESTAKALIMFSR